VIRIDGLDLVKECIELDIVDSTNQYALDTGKPALLVIAREQSAGRGRKGRQWQSPSGLNVYLTMTLGAPDPRYPIVAGVAVRAHVESLLGEADVKIKWPNDILIRKRKVCGILCESRGGITAVGIGVNTNQTSWPDEIKDKAISLCLVSGKTYEIDDVIRGILESMDRWFGIYQGVGFAPVRENFLANSLSRGCWARLEDGSLCRIMDLTLDGQLVVDVSGRLQTVLGGDVTLDY